MLENIKKAQHAIIDSLSHWESSLAYLYGLYAELFPGNREFWLELVRAEKFHARVLQGLHQVIDDGHLLQNIGEFSKEMMADDLETLKQALKAAQGKSISEREAILTALNIERSVVESRFYEVVTCDSPLFAKVSTVLMSETRDHISQIRDQLDKIDLD